jgi:hypothetical protein
MKLAICAVVLAVACGGKPATQKPGGTTITAEGDAQIPATRWLPAKPTYAFAAKNIGDAQRHVRDLFDAVGAPFEDSSAALTRSAQAMFGIDILSEAAVASIGVDVTASVAVFSDGANPTLVARLADPDRFNEWIDGRRNGASLKTSSVVIDGIEVFSAKEGMRNYLSWAVADGWLWVHVSLASGKDDRASWFSASRKGGSDSWGEAWAWARGAVGSGEDPGVVGFAEPAGFLANLTSRVDEARVCLDLFKPVKRVAFGIDGEGKTIHGRVAIDVGDSAKTIAAAAVPVSAGWSSVEAGAPIAAQVNLDLVTLSQWGGACMTLFELEPAQIDSYGVTSGRATLLSFDPDEPTASNFAVALELSSQHYFANLLDFPLRSTLEKKMQFGPYQGKRLSPPFTGITLDYILNDTMAWGAIGDGVLERAIGQGDPKVGDLLKLDVTFDALTTDAWEGLIDFVWDFGDHPEGAIGPGEQIAASLSPWKEAHARLSVEGTNLVLDASATRR